MATQLTNSDQPAEISDATFLNLFTFLAIGLIALVIGSNYAVIHGEKIALIIGIPKLIVGLTVLAIGTSLPELAVTISALLKNKNQMVLGNIIGSNVLNIAVVMPILGIFSNQNYDASMDAVRALLFPLHITAFCLCDSLAEDAYLEASQIIVVSASSKTAIGLAQGLDDAENAPKTIGLTSSGNTEFVKSLGCYDEVISYDELSNLDYSKGSVMVDMAGNREILGTLHKELGDNMLKCLTVGMTHWDNETTAEDALGQAMLRDRTEFFFAPAHIQKRIGDWGHDGYAEKTNLFMNARALQSKNWMQLKEIHGLENFTSTYKEMVAGKINPSEGIIVNLKNI